MKSQLSPCVVYTLRSIQSCLVTFSYNTIIMFQIRNSQLRPGCIGSKPFMMAAENVFWPHIINLDAGINVKLVDHFCMQGIFYCRQHV